MVALGGFVGLVVMKTNYSYELPTKETTPAHWAWLNRPRPGMIKIRLSQLERFLDERGLTSRWGCCRRDRKDYCWLAKHYCTPDGIYMALGDLIKHTYLITLFCLGLLSQKTNCKH